MMTDETINLWNNVCFCHVDIKKWLNKLRNENLTFSFKKLK